MIIIIITLFFLGLRCVDVVNINNEIKLFYYFIVNINLIENGKVVLKVIVIKVYKEKLKWYDVVNKESKF